MLWYDLFRQKNSILFLNRKKHPNSSINKMVLTNSPQTKHNYFTNIYIIPTGWDIIIMQNYSKKCIYVVLYSSTYFFKIPVYSMSNVFKFDLLTNQLFIQNLFINNFVVTYYKMLKSFYGILLKPFFTKITFKGKGYYIFKNYRNTITPQFGYSHRLYLYAFYVYVVFLSKTSLIVFGLNRKHVTNLSKSIFTWRPINIFTGRGVRFSRQIIYKKSGKVSSYR
jgi:hypothetical protein